MAARRIGATATLAETMNAIADTHGFYAVSVSINRKIPSLRKWSAYVSWDGFARDGIGCASGGGETPLQALEAAIMDAARDREPWLDDEKDRQIASLRAQLEALEAR